MTTLFFFLVTLALLWVLRLEDATATHTCGTTWGYSNEGSGAYIAIGQAIDIDIPGDEISATDITHLNITDCYRQFLPGLGDGNEFTVNMNYVAATYNTLRGLLRLTKDWQITLADGSTFECTGFITRLGKAIPEDDRYTNTVTIKISGKPSFTAA